MAICDVCSTPIGPEAKRYSASQIKTAVRAGFRPPAVAFELAAAFGLSQAQAEAEWVQRALADTTDWLLCPSCDSQAGRHLGQSQAQKPPPRVEKAVEKTAAPVASTAPAPPPPPAPSAGGPLRMDYIAPPGKVALEGDTLTFRRGRLSSETESLPLDALRLVYLFLPKQFKWHLLQPSQHQYQWINLDTISDEDFLALRQALSEQHRVLTGDFSFVLADFQGRVIQVAWKKLAEGGLELLAQLRRHKLTRREKLVRWLEGNPSITIAAKGGSFRAGVGMNTAGVAQGSSKFTPWSDLEKTEMTQMQSMVDVCYFRFIPTKTSRRKKIVTGVDPKQAEVCLAELDFWRSAGQGSSTEGARAAAEPRPAAPPASVPASTLATVSLAAGIATWTLLPLIGALIAVVTGHLARKEIRESQGTLGGKGRSTGGLALGYIQLALALLIPILMILSASSKKERTTSTRPTATLVAGVQIVTMTPAARQATATLDVRPLTATAEALQKATATARAEQAEATTWAEIYRIQTQQAAATATAQAAPTLTPTPHPVLPPTWTPVANPDPAAARTHWPLLLLDTFDTNANNWPLGSASDEFATMTESLVNGKYRWNAVALRGVHSGAQLPGVVVSDFYLAAEVQQMDETINGLCGLEFRIVDASNRYYLGLYNSQYFSFHLMYQGQWTTLIGLTPTAALRAGGANRIAVMAEGSHFDFFINDQFVASADDAHLSSGGVGLAIDLNNAGDQLAFEFDNFELHALPSAAPTITPAPPSPTPTGEAQATPAAQAGSAISADNAGQVKQLALWDEGLVNQAAWSPDGRLLAVASYSLYLLDADTLQPAAVIDTGGWTDSVAFSPDGTVLASTSMADGAVRLWDTASGRELRAFAGFELAGDVAFSPDGARLAASDMMMTVKILDLNSGSELFTLSGHYAVFAVAFAPDGQTIATADIGESILWDAATGRELRAFSSQDFSQVNSVAFSPDGKILAAGDIDGRISLWDVASGTELHTLAGHTDQVTSVAFSPDGRLLASASWDLTVRLWDVSTALNAGVASGAELTSLTGHSEWVQSVAFSPDGALLASGSNDGTLRLWGVGP
ncbi:MAG: DUF4190 domain-containing protein [Chloroflexota bacterium]